MARELQPVDLSTTPELAELADEVQRTQQPRVLRRDNQDVAVLMPVRAPKRRRHPPAPRDPLAVVERTAGIFKQYAKTPPPTPRDEKDAFEQAVAEQVMESMTG